MWDLVGDLHGAQLPYWRGYHCCKTGHGGLTDPVTGSMEECGIPGLHKNPTPGTGISGKGLSGRHQPIPLVLCLRVLNSLRGPLPPIFLFFLVYLPHLHVSSLIFSYCNPYLELYVKIRTGDVMILLSFRYASVSFVVQAGQPALWAAMEVV